jgi:hypothetical protein
VDAFGTKGLLMRKISILILFSLIVLNCFSEGIINIHGRIVTYEYIKIENCILYYSLYYKGEVEEQYQSTNLSSDGGFTIVAKDKKGEITIDGIDPVNFSVVNGINIEFSGKQDIELGSLYNYKTIHAKYTPDDNVLKSWIEFDIDDSVADYYEVEILGRIPGTIVLSPVIKISKLIKPEIILADYLEYNDGKIVSKNKDCVVIYNNLNGHYWISIDGYKATSENVVKTRIGGIADGPRF